MARTKQNKQKLGGHLQSVRAKHDTALEAEILGKLAAKSTTKDKKPPKVGKQKQKQKQKADLNGEPAKTGKKPSRKSTQDAKKEKRREHKKELTEMLASDLAIESRKASELIKQTNTQFTMSQMSRAVNALHKSSGGKFTEGEFMTKVAEFNGVDKQATEKATLNKAARRAEAEATQSGSKKAKKRSEKEKKGEPTPMPAKSGKSEPQLEPASSRQPEHSERQQASEILSAKVALPGNDGFSTEFWMGLAGSREAAAVAAT